MGRRRRPGRGVELRLPGRGAALIPLAAALRLAAGLGVAGAGLVAVLPSPTARLWQASIVLGEGGYWLALLAAPLLADLRGWRGWRHSPARAAAVALTLTGIVLLLSPVARAVSVGRTLPALLEARFGAPAAVDEAAGRGARPRPGPVSLPALLTGVRSAEVVVDEHVYAVRDDGDLRLDLYRPAYAEGTLPVVVMVHGGSWRSGDKREFAALNEYLAARGYVVAAIGYRLLPRAGFPAAQDDLAEAIRYLGTRAETHNLDPGRIALVGRSAGGQIALLGAYAARDPAVRGVVSFYAPAALRWGYANPAKPGVIDSSGVLDEYLGGPPATHGAQYDAAEPARFVTAEAPPTLFLQGLRDEHVSPFHAEFVSARLLEEGVPHAIVRLPWATHGCDFVFRGPCGQVSTFAVEWFLGAVLR